MSTYAMGQATKTGVEIRCAEEKRKFTCKSRAVGNMHMPDPVELEDKFFATLTPEDFVVSPAGANYTMLRGAYEHTSNVFWIDPGTLAEKMNNGLKGKSGTTALLELFESQRDLFYQYQPSNARCTTLLLAVRDWLNIEAQLTAANNSVAQHLRRERDLAVFKAPERKAWIERETDREVKKIVKRNRTAGIKLEKDQIATMRATLTKRMAGVYDGFFGDSNKELGKAQKRIIDDRITWFGIDELLEDAEARVQEILDDMPESKLFDGLVGEGAIKARAQVLAFIRNPQLYECFPQLEHYAGVGKLDGGQALRRQYGVRQVGRPEFRKALCFDFGEKYWQCDRIGFFKGLYYAYKRHQYLRFYDLMQITADVWPLFGRTKTDDEGGDEDAPQATEEVSDEELAATTTDKSKAIRDIAERLEKISDLPMIARNPDVQRAIASLKKQPDAKLLWKLFTRGGEKDANGKVSSGYNLQMTPARIERQVKRMTGIVLLQAIYYRWLKMLDAPLPLAEDHKYVAQWRYVNKSDGLPMEYDHELALKYFTQIGDELEKTVKLPPELAIKLVKPEARREYLGGLDAATRMKALLALTDKDVAAYANELPENAREALFENVPIKRLSKVQDALEDLKAAEAKVAAKSLSEAAEALDGETRTEKRAAKAKTERKPRAKAKRRGTRKAAKTRGKKGNGKSATVPVELTAAPPADAE